MQGQTATKTSAPPQFIIREYEPRDLRSVLDLIKLGSGGPTETWDESYWRWEHFDNPFGQSILFVATNGAGQIISLRSSIRWRFKAGSMIVKAVRSSNLVTHPDYRGHGVLTALSRRVIEKLRNDNIDQASNGLS